MRWFIKQRLENLDTVTNGNLIVKSLTGVDHDASGTEPYGRVVATLRKKLPCGNEGLPRFADADDPVCCVDPMVNLVGVHVGKSTACVPDRTVQVVIAPSRQACIVHIWRLASGPSPEPPEPSRGARAIFVLMEPSKDKVARELVEWHFGVEPDLSRVIRIVSENEDAPDEPIKLLEVNAATVATGTIEFFAFAPSVSTPFRTVIAEVTPEEYERIRCEELRLPRGWSLANAQLFERPRAA